MMGSTHRNDRGNHRLSGFLRQHWCRNLRLTKNLRRAMKDKAGWIPDFNDIIPLTAPKMSSSVSLLCNIPMSNTYSSGLLRTCEGLQVFCQRLRGYVQMRDKM